MTTARPVDDRIRSWLLEIAPAELPDRVFDATFERTRSMSQASGVRPWRTPSMNPLARMTAAVIAVVLLIGTGAYLLGPGPQTGGTPTSSPSVSATPLPTSSATASASPTPTLTQTSELGTPSPLQGRAASFAAPFTYTLPAGEGLVATDSSEIGVWQFRHPAPSGDFYDRVVAFRRVYGGRADPCNEVSQSRDLADPQAYIDYFKSIPTVAVSDVRSVTVDGRPAKQAVLSFDPATAACPDVWLFVADPISITQNIGRGSARVTVLDVDGITIAIMTIGDDTWLPVADQFIASIRFDAPPPSPSES
jgi:hypothetical protein